MALSLLHKIVRKAIWNQGTKSTHIKVSSWSEILAKSSLYGKPVSLGFCVCRQDSYPIAQTTPIIGHSVCLLRCWKFAERIARRRERCRFLFDEFWGTQMAEKSLLPWMSCQGEPQKVEQTYYCLNRACHFLWCVDCISGSWVEVYFIDHPLSQVLSMSSALGFSASQNPIFVNMVSVIYWPSGCWRYSLLWSSPLSETFTAWLNRPWTPVSSPQAKLSLHVLTPAPAGRIFRFW